MSLTVTTAPAQDILTVSEMAVYLRLDDGTSPLVLPDQALIESLIQVATSYLDAENGILGRALITQTIEETFDDFPEKVISGSIKDQQDSETIELKIQPVQSVNSITYIDLEGSEQTLATSQYTVVLNDGEKVCRIYPVNSWPEAKEGYSRVTVNYTAGYGDEATDVPIQIRTAAKMLVATLYENRESEMALAPGQMLTKNTVYNALLAPFIRYKF